MAGRGGGDIGYYFDGGAGRWEAEVVDSEAEFDWEIKKIHF